MRRSGMVWLTLLAILSGCKSRNTGAEQQRVRDLVPHNVAEFERIDASVGPANFSVPSAGTPLDLRFDCDSPRICTLTLSNTGAEPIYLRKALEFDSTPIIRTARLVYVAPDGDRFTPSPYSTTPDILGTFGWMAPSETVVAELDKKTLLMVCEESGHAECDVHVEYELEEVPELFKDKPYWQGIVESNSVTITPI